jgi:hypothetical protein
MRVAICFWGIARSLKYTHNSIKENIFNVLKHNNIEFETFFYTYSINTAYNNVRANEKVNRFDNDQYKYIEFDNFKMVPQEDVRNQLNINSYKSRKDPFNNNYSSVQNYILAMYSRKNAFKMINDSEKQYTHFLFIRPDMKYLNKINIRWFTDCDKDTIYIPAFHQYNFKFNDRMALCSNLEIARLYGNCFDGMLEYSRQNPLHSETYIRYYLLKNYKKLKIISIPFYFNRVRYNGFVLNDCSS